MQPATKQPAAKVSAPRPTAPSPHRPVHKIRMGRITAAIWENDTQNGVWHNVTVDRVYKDGEEWKRTSSFGRDDLPLVSKVLDQAHTWIFQHAQAGHDAESGEE